MRVSFDHQAGQHERYAPDAFASQIGKRVRLSVQGEPRGTCTLVAAKASPGGGSVTLTYDLPDDLGYIAARVTNVREMTPFSLSFVFPPAEPRRHDPENDEGG